MWWPLTLERCWASSILTLVTWVQRTQAGLRPHQTRRLGRRAFGPRPRPILTHPALLAAGGYVRPFGPNESLIRLKPTRILDSKPHYTAPSCPKFFLINILSCKKKKNYRGPNARRLSLRAWCGRRPACVRCTQVTRVRIDGGVG